MDYILKVIVYVSTKNTSISEPFIDSTDMQTFTQSCNKSKKWGPQLYHTVSPNEITCVPSTVKPNEMLPQKKVKRNDKYLLIYFSPQGLVNVLYNGTQAHAMLFNYKLKHLLKVQE